jgi:predicted DCC family thiol-disulfide oxidoreductase YuxK
MTTAPPTRPALSHPIVFFDGVCVLCNGFVDRVLRADREGKLRFAPLQGETARALLPPLGDDPERWSVLYLDEEGLHERSDVSLRVWRRLGGAYRLLALLRFVPRPLRDAVYRLIARNRYRWFGKREACRLPTPAEAERFLP